MSSEHEAIPKSCFDNRSREEISNSICVLTCLLSGTQIGQPEDRRAHHSRHSRDNSALKIMDHIATLLTTKGSAGTATENGGDSYTGGVIAVTGRVNPEDNSMDILVARNTPTRLHSAQSIEVKELKGREHGADTLRDWNKRSIEDHFADTFTILDWLRISRSEYKTQFTFALYIIKHAHIKIAGRMTEGERLWKVHPIHALRSRIPFIAIPNASFPFPLKGISSFTKELIMERGFLPSTTDKRVFVVNKDNLVSWLSLLCDVYRELEDILIDPVPDLSGRRVAKEKVNPGDIFTVAFNLHIVHGLLKSKLVDLVLEDTDFSATLEASYGLAESDLHLKNPAKNCDPAANVPDPLGPVEDVLTESPRMPEEAHRHYVVRYLKTIVDRIDAFALATSSRNISVTLHPYELFLPLHPFRVQSQEQLTQLRRRFVNLVNDVTPAQIDLVIDRDKAKANPHNAHNAAVHAEAGVMGVVCASWNAEGADDTPSLPIANEDTRRALCNMFSEISIGVSKLCCWCCWRLRTLLGELNGKDAAAFPQFLLNGTHARISPWYPPPCGIPRSVLVKMEKELVLEVEKLAKCRDFTSASHWSSPSNTDSNTDDGSQGGSLAAIRKAQKEAYKCKH
ncbi:hypothetical protein OF83DRAFT_1179006 [Amylostereum chailletii]|nr:hypothetical protein OF83DRAFT_1179006 [Amylostereum chailletii]